jgi:hypothetical protein
MILFIMVKKVILLTIRSLKNIYGFFYGIFEQNYTLNLSFIKGSEDTKQDLIVMFLCLMFPRTFNVVTIIHR